MLPPLMLKELVVFPKFWSSLAIFALMIGVLVERRQGHISRPAIVGNAFFLWQIFFDSWAQLPEFLQWYLNIGTVVALIALMSYVLRERLPTGFYKFCYYFYGSLSILVVIGWWFFGKESSLFLFATVPTIVVAFVAVGAVCFLLGGRKKRHRYG